MPPTFIDAYPSYSATGYVTTNEEPEAWKTLVKECKFTRAASIASGGEIPLLVLLPFGKEVVAVDHSYRSVLITYVKSLMLETLGPRDTKKVLEAGNKELFSEAVGKVVHLLPDALGTKLEEMENSKYEGYDPNSVFKYSSLGTGADLNSMRGSWHYASMQTLSAACRHMNKLTLIHGDLVKDLEKYGPFDLMYISNAMEHTGRDHKNPTPSGILKSLADDGTVLMSGYSYTKFPPGWKTISKVAGYRTTWEHHLMQKS